MIYHNSRNINYRKPFGAVEAGAVIRLSLVITEEFPEAVSLMLWQDDVQPEFIPMKEEPAEDGSERYTAEIKAPDEPGLLWYAFALETETEEGRRYFYYGNNERSTGGEGRLYTDHELEGGRPLPYQITVYRKSEVPSWYKDGIVYQIFPDRFARDEGWRERCEASAASVNSRPGGEKRLIEEDWNRKAYYIRDDLGRVTGWPIYGGSFRGIESKLDYLRSLGVTAIYLNPIFDAVSNHRYDTADYMIPDPALGTEEDFIHLAETARVRGIRIILDGVFSHTGADSRYFDRYGNYEGASDKEGRPYAPGAYRSADSPYRSWYRFDENEACGYRSWWGVDDLPEVDEENPGFRDLITGEGGVIEHWQKLGVSGWRLDVADELPDSFIRDIKRASRRADAGSLVIGEVWEDASNKISYDERRKYFAGDELDGVMNYPLRTLLLDYINYTISSEAAGDRLMSLKENYPEENFYSGLNLIGSHDRERIITAMACDEDYESAVRKVRLLSALQYTLPGVPCIYYGDEAGLTGKADPENRNAFPYGYENLDLGYHYRMLGLIYDEHPVLKSGDLRMLTSEDGISEDIFAFVRTDKEDAESGEKILVLANRSYGSAEADLSSIEGLGGGYAVDLLTSDEIPVSGDGFGSIRMERLSVRIICILKGRPETEGIKRGAGVICHISSLGRPCLGTPAREFADFLSRAGMNVWQVLPLNPTGLGGSPYSSYAAFAGDPDLINRDELPGREGLEDFISGNRKWLREYAAYTVAREIQEGRPWTEWPPELRDASAEELIKLLRPSHGELIDRLILDQYYFDVQWKELREYAASLGIRMMGDLPMYIAQDSADAWANRDIFRMDSEGHQSAHAGVPPDAFSKDGQDWGNPLYDWDVLRKRGYDWWLRRLRQCAERFDILRIDHFRGLSEYYAVPEGCTPASGTWQHSGGLDFIKAARSALRCDASEDACTGNGCRTEYGGMKLLAEDLGFLDAGVKNLLLLTGLPGMDIWQFSAEEMMELAPEKAANRVFYTGTHDNDTLAGFTEGRLSEAWEAIRKIYESPAVLAMLQLQDVLLLGSDARMNVPGVPEGNWKWKMPEGRIEDNYRGSDGMAVWLRSLAEKNGRLG